MRKTTEHPVSIRQDDVSAVPTLRVDAAAVLGGVTVGWLRAALVQFGRPVESRMTASEWRDFIASVNASPAQQ